VDGACDAALTYRFRGVVVPSGAVTHAKRRLMNTGIKVVSTVGFPHGNQSPEVKAHEAQRAAAMGADELDYVISIGAALDGDVKYLREEAVAIIRVTRGKLLKAILEVGYLTEEQRFLAAQALADAGVHYVKTCTGFGPGRATVEDVRLLVRAAGRKALVKASGGVREAWQVVELLSAGAAVVGTSHGPEICGP
jgi:deoxyribose-phosphate aldolase